MVFQWVYNGNIMVLIMRISLFFMIFFVWGFFMKLRTFHCTLCGFLSQLLTGGHHLANIWSVQLAWFTGVWFQILRN